MDSDNPSDTDDESYDSNSDNEAQTADSSIDMTTLQAWMAGASRPTATWYPTRIASSSPSSSSSQAPSPSPSPSPSLSPSPSPSSPEAATPSSEGAQDLKRKAQPEQEQDLERKRPWRSPYIWPIEKDRTIMKYTVFRTHQTLRRSVSDGRPGTGDNNTGTGTLAGARVFRVASFVDKNKANQRAAQLLRGLWTPSARRVELDCSDREPNRDGMFSGSIELATGKTVSIYVDRETASFGETGLAGYSSSGSGEEEEDNDDDEGSEADDGNTLREEYAELLLRPRYDVFVFVRKVLDEKEGYFEVRQYKEDEEAAETTGRVSESCQSSSDDSSDSDSESESETGEYGNRRGMREENAVLPPSPTSPVRHTSPSPPPPPPPTTHWVPHHEGSFTTFDAACCRLMDAFAEWTRPPEPLRLDAVMFYRDVLRPSIAELVQEPEEGVDEEQDDRDHPSSSSSDDGTVVEFHWTPMPQLRYAYEDITATVVKSRLQGPLDLTGAVGRRSG